MAKIAEKNEKTVEEVVIETIAESQQIDDPSIILPESRLDSEEIGIDPSIDLLDIIFQVERKMGIRIPQPNPIPETVQDLINIVQEVVNTKKQS